MRKHLSLAAAIAAISASYTTPGIAQTQQAVLEEVVVTARKRSETLQDVPFSIAAKTEGQLRRSGATNLETMADGVAGLAVQNLGPGQSQVAIRGISAGQIVRDQPGVKEQVGVYLDESVISLSLFTPDLDFYDTNRVEVLRGPQGTLFGSGSLAGTIRYISNEPDLAEDSGSLTTTVQHVKDGEVGGSLKGHTNVVLGERAALRAVAYTEQFAGYIDAIQPNGGEEEDVNSGEKHGVRIALKFQPTENVTLTPRVVWQDIDMDGFNREDHYNVLANPFTTTRPAITLGEREQYTQLEENFEDEFLLVDFDATVNFNEMVFTSITSWTDREVIVERDATALTGFFNSGDPQGESVYALDATLADTTDVEMITQEFRLASDNADALQWVAGVFYTQIDRNYAQSLMVPGYEAAGGQRAPTQGKYAAVDELYYSDIPYELTQTALFGEMSYDVTSRLNMTIGARFFDFDEDREVVINGVFGGLTEREEDTESSGISPRLLVRYDLNDDVMLNAQVAKGFRLGGINDPINTNLCTPADAATFGGFNEFDDEEVINYEVGAKTTAFGGRGTFNVSAFYSDIENLQATLDAGTCSSRIVYNVEEAHSQGIEIEITARPTDAWEVSVAASYIDAELDSTVTSTDSGGNVTILGGIEDGNELPTAPDYSVALVSTNYFQWNQDWEGYFTAAFQSVGARYTQIVDQTDGAETIDVSGGNAVGNSTATTINFDQELDNYQTVNLRLGGRTANWDLALFVNNATDENIRQSVDREAGGAARIGYRVGQPRTAGITARYDF
ncbi:iron complex outermembrane receptor protein [Litorivivens lipolytica]|uniref:Iron complex outermembrane receptor protein n=1 Tax=Litorivivens lipolytica TaxID=1524264 RepID=A0A7W4W697_9GAMM|nr:TonB-dependent receptor [Litorivivens lipolytica]MBB3047848.1 iron complex outermembrane receptor protein [Litorivivens lipolytica]